MTKEDDSFPGVEVVTDSQNRITPKSAYVHLDDADEYDTDEVGDILYVYIVGDDRVDELNDEVQELRSNYVYSQGIVFPEWFGVEEYSSDVLDAVRQVGFIDPPVEPADVEEIVETIETNE